MSVEGTIKEIAKGAKDASRQLRKVERSKKDEALVLMADKLMSSKENIKEENAKDLSLGREKGLSSAMIDRLTLEDKTIDDFYRF